MDANPVKQVDAANPRRSLLGWGVGVLVVALMWAAACSSNGGGSGVAMEGWTDGLEAGRSLAAEQGKPMVVMFTADWCGPCQQLKAAVLLKPEVKQKLAAEFVAVRVDLTNNSPNNPATATARDYGVTSIPKLVAMDAQGVVISSYSQSKNPADFIAWLDSI